jgi:anti-sigma factor (TIGR02949 family)
MSDAVDPCDCLEAIEHLYEYLDGELTPEREAAIKAHLGACAHCFSLFGFEHGYLKFLEARARAQEVPPALRRRILDTLLEGGAAGRP